MQTRFQTHNDLKTLTLKSQAFDPSYYDIPWSSITTDSKYRSTPGHFSQIYRQYCMSWGSVSWWGRGLDILWV